MNPLEKAIEDSGADDDSGPDDDAGSDYDGAPEKPGDDFDIGSGTLAIDIQLFLDFQRV